jgi:hypothetical protein
MIPHGAAGPHRSWRRHATFALRNAALYIGDL